METLKNPVPRAVLTALLARFVCRCGTPFSGGSDAEQLGEPSARAFCPNHPDEQYALVVVRLERR